MEYQNNVLPYVHAEEDTTSTTASQVAEKPSLTDDEKKKFNDVFRDRYAELQEKTRKDTAKALEEQAQKLKTDFEAQIAALTSKKVDKSGEAVDETAEAKRIVADYKRTIEERERDLKNYQTQLKDSQTKIQALNKDRAITDALSGIPFVNLKQVKVLTGDQIEIDPETGNYVVRNDDGQIIIGDDFKPASLKDFFSKYAEQNPHMVKSGVVAGAGSTPNGAPGTPGEFAHIKTKADLAGPQNMQLRIRFVEKYGPEKYAALPLK